MLNEFECIYSDMFHDDGGFSGTLTVRLCDGLYLYTVSREIRTEGDNFHYLADISYAEAKNIITTLLVDRYKYLNLICHDYDVSIEKLYPEREHSYLYNKR